MSDQLKNQQLLLLLIVSLIKIARSLVKTLSLPHLLKNQF